MNGEPIFVVALGASTAVGRDAWSSAAAVRAGISGFTQHPYMIDTAGEPMRVAIAPWLDIGLSGVERFEALLFPAIDQALAPVSEVNTERLRIALSLGLPAPRPGLADGLQPTLVKTLGEKYRQVFSAVATFPNGHAAGLLALDAAAKKLAQGAFDACVVAGVDSYIEPETLEWLEESDQLHSAGPLNNAWGFIPGEGAGALLLMQRQVVERLRLTPLARVLGVGTAFEHKRIKTETVCIGEGLTQAFRSALTTLPDGMRVTDVYCDMNGEPYRADEYGFTCLRTKGAFESASDFIAPADCWGDVAAAGAPLHVMLAAIAGVKGYANGHVTFAWASAEGGERSAVLMAVGGSA
ncbi:MAG: beta-ketoacyl synthase N-terminal-like domain-containing protein [Gammaproteobacteria bacterium]